MRYELPIFGQIREDTRLSKRALQVWCVVIEQLDAVDPREWYPELVEIRLSLDRTTVYRAVRTLVDAGYLVRHGATMLRVPLSRVPAEPHTTNPSPAAPVAEVEAASASTPRARARRGPRVLSKGPLRS
jgi:hypothetical protein